MAIGDGFERGLEVGVRVDIVHLGRFGQRSDASPGRRTLVMAGEQGTLATQRQWPDGVFHDKMPISAYCPRGRLPAHRPIRAPPRPHAAVGRPHRRHRLSAGLWRSPFFVQWREQISRGAPRERGNRSWRVKRKGWEGSIPAHAGLNRTLEYVATLHESVPRACGAEPEIREHWKPLVR